MRADAYLCASLDEVQSIRYRARGVLAAGRVTADANVNKLLRTMGLEPLIFTKRRAVLDGVLPSAFWLDLFAIDR